MRYFITVDNSRLGGTWQTKKDADRALRRIRQARRGEGAAIVLHKDSSVRRGMDNRATTSGRYGKRYPKRGRARRRKNSAESLGTSLLIVGIAAGAGAALSAVSGAPVTVPRVLAGASGGAGIAVLLGLVGIIFDVEVGIETAGIGLLGAIVLGAAAGISTGPSTATA